MSKKRVAASGLSIPQGVKHFTPTSHRDVVEPEVQNIQIEEEVQKETYMLPKKLVEQMEGIGLELKRQMIKGKATKTSMVIYALKLLFQDYTENGSESKLAKEFLR